MLIPYQRLAPETLAALIESFVFREGTDYGASEVALRTKVEQIQRQIEAGVVVIVYEQSSDSFNLVRRDDLSKLDLNETN